MAVCTQEDTFLDFLANRFPTSCVSPIGNTKVLLRRIKMVKLQRFTTPIVPAPAASTTQAVDCFLPYLLAPFFDSFNQILAAISVCSLVSPRERAPLLQPHALPLSYRGACSLGSIIWRVRTGILTPEHRFVNTQSPFFDRQLARSARFRPTACHPPTPRFTFRAILGIMSAPEVTSSRHSSPRNEPRR